MASSISAADADADDDVVSVDMNRWVMVVMKTLVVTRRPAYVVVGTVQASVMVGLVADNNTTTPQTRLRSMACRRRRNGFCIIVVIVVVVSLVVVKASFYPFRNLR